MNRTVYIPPQRNDDFWTHDAPLFVGKFPYYRNDPRMVQARLHVSEEKFWYEKHEIIPLNMKRGEIGKRTYVMMHPYVLELELFMTVGMYPKPKHYADQPKFSLERSKAILEDENMQKLWKAFEHWLIKQFPDATRIATPFNDPIAKTIEEYQTFLRTLDYHPSPTAEAAFEKAI